MYDCSAARALPRTDYQPIGTAQEQVQVLISRYPNLSETELARLINLYRGLLRPRHCADALGRGSRAEARSFHDRSSIEHPAAVSAIRRTALLYDTNFGSADLGRFSRLRSCSAGPLTGS